MPDISRTVSVEELSFFSCVSTICEVIEAPFDPLFYGLLDVLVARWIDVARSLRGFDDAEINIDLCQI